MATYMIEIVREIWVALGPRVRGDDDYIFIIGMTTTYFLLGWHLTEATAALVERWVLAFAGMTDEDIGMTDEDISMTNEGINMPMKV